MVAKKRGLGRGLDALLGGAQALRQDYDSVAKSVDMDDDGAPEYELKE